VAVRSFKSSTSSKRSMDRKTADALKREKAAQKKVDDRSEQSSSNGRRDSK
jgi:hypothetical protein